MNVYALSVGGQTKTALASTQKADGVWKASKTLVTASAEYGLTPIVILDGAIIALAYFSKWVAN